MSQEAAAPPLKRTSLHPEHVALGAKMVPFGGWEMPVQYSGIIEEHQAVRQAVGLFDVSHMGEFRVTGAGAEAFVQKVVANDVAKLAPDQALYTQFTRPDGGTVDDLLVYRQPDGFLLVVNASNIEKDWAWLHGHKPADVTLTDESDATAMVALQGPRAEQMLTEAFSPTRDAAAYGALKPFRWMKHELAGVPVVVARTGYTGEDGFEIFCAAEHARALWQMLLGGGQPYGLKPAGLGARDTLRLEAGLPLYGHELTDAVSPVMAGVGWSVKPGKGDFVGREVLAAQKADLASLPRRIVGLKMAGRNIAREGYAVYAGDRKVGEVVSGTFSPTLQVPIATALVAGDAAAAPLHVEIRGQRHPAETVKLPFYRHP